MRYRTTHDMKVKWGPNHTFLSCYETFVPKGTEVETCSWPDYWWVKHPEKLFPEDQPTQRQYAIHYGIAVRREDVEAWEE